VVDEEGANFLVGACLDKFLDKHKESLTSFRLFDLTQAFGYLPR
jgi:hypothetical protein